jgi:hypothetical protein
MEEEGRKRKIGTTRKRPRGRRHSMKRRRRRSPKGNKFRVFM